MLVIRSVAAVVFTILIFIGLAQWIGSAAPGHEMQAVSGLALFLSGLIGLLLVDVAWSLGELVKDGRDEREMRAAAREIQAQQRAGLSQLERERKAPARDRAEKAAGKVTGGWG